MKSHAVNKKTNFIGGWYIDQKVCTDLIDYFENSSHKKPGQLGLINGKVGIDKKAKLSTDVFVSPNNQEKVIINYYKELYQVLEAYKKKYQYCNTQQLPWSMVENWQLQKYKPNQGYFLRHFERTGGITVNRHLTFMTYLNTLKQGGETEFYYQKLKIKPEAGLTLIWGTDWTMTHRGITSKKETKYIATGWYSFD
jgi:hypothetical protein